MGDGRHRLLRPNPFDIRFGAAVFSERRIV
jgi:hypothetical protein